MINSEKTYQKGREIIFIVGLIMATLGFIGNLIKNIDNHSLTLNVIYCISIFILLSITLLFFLKIRTNTLYIITLTVIMCTLLIAQTLISSNPNFDEIVEKHILTNTLFILMLIIISGFVIGSKLSYALFLLLAVYLILRPFQVDLPYIYENLILILVMMTGVVIAISFFINNLELFIVKVNEQSIILERKNKEISDNINYAERIQTTILPENELLISTFKEHFVFVKPKDVVSSNFYFLEIVENNIYISVVNCNGESVSGSLMTVVANYGLNMALKDLKLTQPNEIITKTKDFIFSRVKNLETAHQGMELVFCSLSNNILTYCGDNDFLWILSNGEIKEHGASCIEDDHNYLNEELTLLENDIVFLISGGVIKQLGSKGALQKDKATFQKMLVSIKNENMNVQRQKIEDFWIMNYSNEKQLDDICVLAFRI